MFKEYKKKLLMKHHAKVKELIKEENDKNNSNSNNEVRLDIFNRSDLLEKVLIMEMKRNSDNQLSIIN